MSAYKGPYIGPDYDEDEAMAALPAGAATTKYPYWERRDVKWWHWIVLPHHALWPWVRQGIEGRPHRRQSDFSHAQMLLREQFDPEDREMNATQQRSANYVAGREG